MQLKEVVTMPNQLEEGILYVSYEYSTAAHLCACGCGVKIRTPLGPTEWNIKHTKDGPSVWPSIGNWQQKCRSHYIIKSGQILWEENWEDEQIIIGRNKENLRRETYYKKKYSEKSLSRKMLVWLQNILK